MATLAMGISRSGTTILWEVGATGSKGFLSVSAEVGGRSVLSQQASKGYSMTASGSIEDATLARDSVHFSAQVVDLSTGYGGTPVTVSGTLLPGQTFTRAENRS